MVISALMQVCYLVDIDTQAFFEILVIFLRIGGLLLSKIKGLQR